MMAQTMKERSQVLIVGGGIVGLSASLFLSSHKIPHLLVERHSGTSIIPRSRGVNTRTMEIFRSIQMDEAVREAGRDLAFSSGFYRGTSLFEVIEPRKRKKKGPSIDAMPGASLVENVSPVIGARVTQDKLEPVLLEAASERGGQVRFSTECSDLQQDENGITATLRDRESGTISTVHTDYVIAADGAGSPIRQQLGIGTTGKGTLGHLLNVLFRADLRDFVRGREFSLCEVVRPEVRGFFASINNNDIWTFHISYDPAKGQQAADYTKERVEELVRCAVGIPDVEIEIKSVLPWQPSDRVAEKLQHGRIFLAGDAAHQMTPYAGQGATTGIADVYDLSWKLAAVLKQYARPSLLETYNIERLPVGQFSAQQSGELADEYGLPSKKFASVVWILGMIRRLPMYFGLGYTYDSPAVIAEETAPTKWTWWWYVPWSIPSLFLSLNGQPGTRAPHIWVQHEGRRKSSLDLFGKTFVLLAGSEGKPWCQAAFEIAPKFRSNLVAYRVGPTGDLSDPKCQWDSIAGVSSQGALLVRPDGFVACRIRDQEGDLVQRLEQTLERVLGW